MVEILNQILNILLQQGLAGAVIIALGYAYFLRGKKLDEAIEHNDNLHKTMYSEAEKDNIEKLDFLNQQIIATTKMGEALKSLTGEVKNNNARLEAIQTSFAELKGKLGRNE